MPDNLVFAGTPGFALVCLEALVRHDMTPVLVLTQPDRPSGRGRKLSVNPVKRYADAQGIPSYQPETLASPNVASKLKELRADAIIVAAYGLLFPPAILELPRAGCVNVHASLLPRWRGAAPVQAAILHGDRKTGVSLMRMEEGLDTGPVYVSESLATGQTETAGLLRDRLAALGGELLVRHLPAILAGGIRPVVQDEQSATYARRISTADARLDWRAPALQLARSVRAYNPEPGAWFMLDDERIKCWSAEVLADAGNAAAAAGTVLAAGRKGIDVACGDGAIRLLKLQRPGRGRVSASEFSSQRTLYGKLLPL